MPYTKEQSKEEISKLIEKYERIQAEGQIKRYNEETTKKDFILPLFEALGWDVYNKKADEVTAEEKASKKRVDYAFRINGIPKLFVEAKAFRKDLDQPKWANQAINYAWYKSVVWAVLTDFEGIKVFNAEVKSTYPLQGRLFSLSYRQYIDQFDQLWLLSRESLEQGLLDQKAEKWGKKLKKVPVDKQLLDDFTRWRELLSKDILKLNLDKHLTEEELDESVQRILDRLIFIRSCEDRELEEKVLLPDLREWADRGRGALVKKVRERFVYFNDIYDSELFKNHLCDDLEINNEVLKDIIYGLHKTKDMGIPYDFSAIDADVLGTIYEQYLGHLLKKTPKRAKLESKEAHRKEQGIYYTPTYIVDYIVKSTLGELLKDKKVDAENIKILDPACGSGSFLIKSFDVLNEYWAKKNRYDQTELDTETGAMKPFTRKVKILKNNIFGVDLDPKAVEIARLNLLLKIAEKKQRLPLLQESIKCGNSLIDDLDVAGDKAFKWEDRFKDVMDEGGFDVVIGNPPYISFYSRESHLDSYRNELKFLLRHYELTQKYNDRRLNTVMFFIEKGMSLLKPNGYLGFIIDANFLEKPFRTIRRLIIDKKWSVIVSKKISVFSGVSSDQVILILTKEPKVNIKILEQNKEKNIVPSKIAITSKEFCMDSLSLNEKKIKLQGTKKLGEIAILSTGIQIGIGGTRRYKGEEIEKLFYKSRKMLESDYENISLKSEDFKRYSQIKIKNYISLNERLAYEINKNVAKCNIAVTKSKPFLGYPKIFIRQSSPSLTATLGKANQVSEYSAFMLKTEEGNLKYLLGILNSKLITYYAIQEGIILQGYKKQPQIRLKGLKSIPIIESSIEIKNRMSIFVDKMLSFHKRLNELGDKKTDERWRIEEEIKKTDAEIDQMVYKLYGLTEEEIKIVEESNK